MTMFRVLEEGATRDEVAGVLARLGYVLRNTWPGGERSAYEEVWATADETSVINYAEDPLTLAHYLSIRGGRPELVLMKIASLLFDSQLRDWRCMARGAGFLTISRRNARRLGAGLAVAWDVRDALSSAALGDDYSPT